MDALAKLSADRRMISLALIVLLSIPPALGWWGVKWFNPPRAEWVTPEDVEALDRAEASFSFAAPVILVLECDNFFRPDRIAALTETVAALRPMPEVTGLVWLGDIAEYSLLHPPKPLLPDPNSGPEVLQAAAQAARRHPLAADHLLSADGTTLTMLLTTTGRGTASTIRDAARHRLQPTGIRVRVTGRQALYDSHDRAIEEDHVRIQIIVYALVAVLAIVIFRRPLAIVVAGTGPVVGVVWTIGWLKLLGQADNELAQIILPVMIMMIGFTDGVHLVVHIRQRREAGASRRDSIYEAVRHVGAACFLTSLTTAIGFGSLMLSDADMIAGFGRVSAIGVGVTFLAVVLITPLLAGSLIGRNIHVAASSDPIGRTMQRFLPVVDFCTRHRIAVSLIGTGLTVGLLIQAMRLVPNDRLTDRVPHDSEEWQAMRHCDEVMGGVRFVRLLISWPEHATARDVWPLLAECEAVLREESVIGKPLSIRTCLTVFSSPQARDTPALVLSLPAELRNQFYRPDLRTAQIVAGLQDRGIAVYEPVFARIREKLSAVAKQHGVTIDVASDVTVEGRIVRRVIRELIQSLILASVVIFVILGVAFRSVRLALISIVPNVLPLAASGAVRFWIDSSLDIASACSFAVCLGIAVDDTIHYLNRFRAERAAGADALIANQRTFRSVGSALMMTTVVMLAGLGTVVSSQLPTHSNFASMGCVTLTAALVADLVFMPALLAWFPGRDERAS